MIFMTLYGWPDNSPPGNSIAYPIVHKVASGTGTYKDPITFASDNKEFKPGTKLYVPSLKKYIIMEDYCVDCAKDWKKGVYHIDLWLNSDSRYKRQTLACENKWTSNVNVVQKPQSNLEVNKTPLFSNGKCL